MASSYWCETCRRIYAPQFIVDGMCPRGHSDVVPVGRFGGMIKGFIAAGGVEERSEAQTRHRQLIHALWSQNERDQQFYQLLTPPVSSEQICQADGCIAPARCGRRLDRHRAATISVRAQHRRTVFEYVDPERFVREMYALFDLTPPTDVARRPHRRDDRDGATPGTGASQDVAAAPNAIRT